MASDHNKQQDDWDHLEWDDLRDDYEEEDDWTCPFCHCEFYCALDCPRRDEEDESDW